MHSFKEKKVLYIGGHLYTRPANFCLLILLESHQTLKLNWWKTIRHLQLNNLKFIELKTDIFNTSRLGKSRR
jgi:hypothetical protein